MSWFSKLTGIQWETPQSARELLYVDGTNLVSTVNSKRFEMGSLTTPSLEELRALDLPTSGPISLEEVVGNVQVFHTFPENAGATFQAASQFNLLEMVGPAVTPEAGIGGYEHDRTQGPACAIACGAGTIYRNYFVPIAGSIGQSSSEQIDCLEDVGKALDNANNAYWTMENGYALPTAGGLARLATVLMDYSLVEKDTLRSLLKIGVQADTEVTILDAGHKVTQIYCSAMPVTYGGGYADDWEEIARLVLEAAYEATLLAAWQNAAKTGNKRVFLTLLGGGAFGNKPNWIVDAILRAINLVPESGLEIKLVSYSSSNAVTRSVLEQYFRSI